MKLIYCLKNSIILYIFNLLYFELLKFVNVHELFQVPLVVKSEDDVMTASTAQQNQNVVPIFTVSSVTGEGLDLLIRFLYVLPPTISIKEKERLEQVNSKLVKLI